MIERRIKLPRYTGPLWRNITLWVCEKLIATKHKASILTVVKEGGYLGTNNDKRPLQIYRRTNISKHD